MDRYRNRLDQQTLHIETLSSCCLHLVKLPSRYAWWSGNALRTAKPFTWASFSSFSSSLRNVKNRLGPKLSNQEEEDHEASLRIVTNRLKNRYVTLRIPIVTNLFTNRYVTNRYDSNPNRPFRRYDSDSGEASADSDSGEASADSGDSPETLPVESLLYCRNCKGHVNALLEKN